MCAIITDCSGSGCGVGRPGARIVRSMPSEGRVKYLSANPNQLGT